jgi:hypothetical protein
MMVGGKSVAVCQEFLRKVLNITKKRLEVIQGKLITGYPITDGRGKHKNRPNKTAQEVWELLHVFCDQLPHSTSHYSYSRTQRKYFSNPQLNMRILWETFIDYYEAVSGKLLSIAFKSFERYFVTHLPFGFRRPRSDVCNMCYEYQQKVHPSDAEKAAINLHQKKVEAYRYLKAMILERAEMDKESVLVLEFDYTQNLPLPKIPVTDQFYKRLLWLFVFNVHLHKRDTSCMYHFLEGGAKKGANSVCSFIYDVICNESHGVTDLFLLSDACSGQNRNWTVVTFLMAIAMEMNIKITHVFPVRGHSYCECDRNFAVYSKQLKKVETVEVPEDYIKIIENSKKTNRFIVKRCEIKDIGRHLQGTFRKPKDLQLSKAVVIKYKPSGEVEIHPNYAQVTPSSFNILKNRQITATSLSASPAADKATITQAKISDVKALLRYVSLDNRHFYNNYFSHYSQSCKDIEITENLDSESELEY